MDTFSQAFAEAAAMVARLDQKLVDIVALSLGVSLSSVALSCAFALPLEPIGRCKHRSRGVGMGLACPPRQSSFTIV